MQIDDVRYDMEIPFSPDTKYFTEIPAVNPLPSNTIIYKSLTGIGASVCEILAARNSIIVLPHISIVKNKHEQHKNTDNTFAVHGNISVEQILDYLTKDMETKKFLTTPKGVDKIIAALEQTSAENDYKDRFFFLLDECHKLIQDAAYRSDLIEVMEHFFTFKNKAMISATPIPPSDPRFVKQGFKHVRVFPLRDYRKPVKLVHTNSIISSFKEHTSGSKAKHFCIFFNSIDGIRDLIKKLKLTKDYKIFCSAESFKLLELKNERNVSAELTALAKFNFFTSSFFNGLDIKLEHDDVDVIMLSDYKYREHTLLDPYTDILQIIGRLRNGYQQAVHINNSSAFTNPISAEQARGNIKRSKIVFEAIQVLKQSFIEPGLEVFFRQATDAIKPYGSLVNPEGKYSFFLGDNYLDEQRIKHYYRNPSKLKQAYLHTNLYKLTEDRKNFEKEERENFARAGLKNSSTINRKFADMLLDLEQYQSSTTYSEQREQISRISPVVFDGYERLGYDNLKKLGFNKRRIKMELLKIDVADKKITLPVLNLIYDSFTLNRYYYMPEIKEKLIEICKQLDIKANVVAKDIELYFRFKAINKYKNEKSNRAYVFLEQKFKATDVDARL